MPDSFYHYTKDENVVEILKAGTLQATAKGMGIYGAGVYVTMLHPSGRAKSQVLANNYGWSNDHIFGSSSSSSSSSGTTHSNNVKSARCNYVIELDTKALTA